MYKLYILYAEAVTNILSEFYVIIFLNKLKIVENTFLLNQNKTSMVKVMMGPFRDSRTPSWISWLQTVVPNKPPLIEPGKPLTQKYMTKYFPGLIQTLQ